MGIAGADAQIDYPNSPSYQLRHNFSFVFRNSYGEFAYCHVQRRTGIYRIQVGNGDLPFIEQTQSGLLTSHSDDDFFFFLHFSSTNFLLSAAMHPIFFI